ncbi:MAG TPA: hypothetical protein P5346_09495 [Spirochaetota bacterium]|nr:hypothetical protein [Spirochaetota bacterium]
MKKSVVTAIIVLACVSIARAGLMSPPSPAGKFILEPHGAVGISMMGGELPDGLDRAMGVGFAYSGGLSFGYGPVSAGAVMFGVEYTGKPFVIHGDYPGRGKFTDTITTNFIDILFGWKGYVSYFYYEAGLFMGFKVGRWEYIRLYDDKDIDRLYGYDYEVDENNGDSDFGVYIGLGGSIPLASFLRLDLGVQLQAAFVPGYEDSAADTTLTTMALMFKAGFTFLI